jgi:branched-chain amino acid transport system permease protein
MMTIFGYPLSAIFGQLILGLVNGSFYALLSLGLAVIFGLLRIVNFAHGALYMLGAFGAHILLSAFGITYIYALILSPLIIAILGVIIEKVCLTHLRNLDPLYGLLLTFGLALIAEGLMQQIFGSSGISYPVPSFLQGAYNLGFMFIPIYRMWVVVISLFTCFMTWMVIEKTSLGSILRASTENGPLTQAFGINVPAYLTATYAFGAGLAGLAGVLAAPITQVSPLMGSSLVIVVFAVVVIGGMGSIIGAIISGIILGLLEGFTKVIYPEASNTIIFIIMALVLLVRPAGLFGRD